MSKTLTFQYCIDTRFNQEPLKWLNDKTIQIEETFKNNKNITLTYENIRTIKFQNCISYRRRFYIKKKNKITWNQIIEQINTIKAEYYKYI